MPPIVLRELEVRCPAIRFHSRFVTVDFSLFLSLLFQDFANGVFGSSFALLIFPFFSHIFELSHPVYLYSPFGSSRRRFSLFIRRGVCVGRF